MGLVFLENTNYSRMNLFAPTEILTEIDISISCYGWEGICYQHRPQKRIIPSLLQLLLPIVGIDQISSTFMSNLRYLDTGDHAS